MKLFILCALLLPIVLADECGNLLPPKVCKEITRAGHEVGLAIQAANFGLGAAVQRLEKNTEFILKTVSIILGDRPEIRDDLIKLTPELQKWGKEQEAKKKEIIVNFRKAIWEISYDVSMEFAKLAEEVEKLVGKGYTSEEIKERLQAMTKQGEAVTDLVLKNVDMYRISQVKFGHKYFAIFKDFLDKEDYKNLNEMLDQVLGAGVVKSIVQEDVKGINYHIQKLVDIMAKLAEELEKGNLAYGLSLETIKAAVKRMSGKLVASVKQRTLEVLAKTRTRS